MDDKDQSNIVSLHDQRSKAKEKLSRKAYLPIETRLRELEEDQVRLIDMVLVLDSNLHYQERIINRLLHLLKQQGEIDNLPDLDK